MKELTGTATQVVAAPIDDCFALFEAVDRYPVWHPDVVHEVDIIERAADGRPAQVRTTLHVAAGPLVHDFHLTMAVATEQPAWVTLTRLRNEPSDNEQLEVRWRLRPENAATRVRLEIAASLSIPRFLPLGGIGDSMADGFLDAAASALTRSR